MVFQIDDSRDNQGTWARLSVPKKLREKERTIAR